MPYRPGQGPGRSLRTRKGMMGGVYFARGCLFGLLLAGIFYAIAYLATVALAC